MDIVTLRELRFRRKYLRQVRHITLDPKGPGVVRLHMVPPKTLLRRKVPYVVILNGHDVLPLNLSWAVLLACLMDSLAPFEGKEVAEADWGAITGRAVEAARLVYPGCGASGWRRSLPGCCRASPPWPAARSRPSRWG